MFAAISRLRQGFQFLKLSEDLNQTDLVFSILDPIMKNSEHPAIKSLTQNMKAHPEMVAMFEEGYRPLAEVRQELQIQAVN
jgi:hypothetical protein